MLATSSSADLRHGGAAALVALLFLTTLVVTTASSTQAATAAASPQLHQHPHEGVHDDNNIMLEQFADQFRCPYAEKWLTKGPKQAALELGLDDSVQEHIDRALTGTTSETKSSSTQQHQSSLRHLQQGPPGLTTPTGTESRCAIAVGPAGAAHQASYATGYSETEGDGSSGTCPGTPAEGSPYMWPLKWTAQVMQQSMPFGTDEVIFTSKNRVWYALDKNYKRSDTYYTRGVQRSIGQSPCPAENRVEDGLFVNACRRNSDQRRTMIHRGSKMYFIRWKDSNETLDDVDVSTMDDVDNIANCTWLDLAIVGNIRPDWYLDNRGDDTDVMYLGNQHVYINANVSTPRLVKQWRKKDFANQYFTMSMLANPYNSSTVTNSSVDEGGIHWPIILNVPGEGFGDDFLQSYSNHRLLSSEEDDLFLLDEAFVAAGGSCPEMVRFGGGGGPPPGVDTGNSTGGPPEGVMAGGDGDSSNSTGGGGPPEGGFGPPQLDVHIPSNLEVDENAWFTNEYTYSPVWEPPPRNDGSMCDDTAGAAASSSSNMATTKAGLATISSCYDEAKGAVHLKFAFDGIVGDMEPLPWVALAYRQSETCRMNPVDGTDGEMLLISPDDDPQVAFGSLPVALRSGSADSLTAVDESLLQLDQVPNGRYSDVHLHVQGEDAVVAPMSATGDGGKSQVELEFHESIAEGKPNVLYMNYAIGMSPQLGYHKNRLCFEIADFPPCAKASEEIAEGAGDNTDDAPSSNNDKDLSASSNESSGARMNGADLFAFIYALGAATTAFCFL